ncbi:TauD/TfdA family dioxygenase [uncultured Thiodictyon sp.]|uniref:TauD/TfdA family dioxygenase n=1 Tax=uncultured Thiodictyon sp. TaxID=1846217 RepID=UPI0025F4D071|nr:TauD/TfdA family dioxygenase [uncultured Thiodictyon sp.]
MANPLVPAGATAPNPFNLTDDDAYRRWRDARLASAPTRADELIVEVRDPRHLTAAEYQAILDRCRRANMAIYVSASGDDPHKSIPAALGDRFGLHRLEYNRGADTDAITSLKVQTDAGHAGYIPYTNRPIAWHTDGYYNTPARQVQGLLLHCVHAAIAGGANALLDHEVAYCLVRDQDPAFITALMHPQCMTIPANPGDGDGELRPEQTGPVFSVTAQGHLHMRYTNRARHCHWRDDPLNQAAVDCLKTVLHTPSPWHLEGRLEPGWGLISNNVLHTRTGFTDGPVPRLIYRARYYDRIAGT